jgi:aminoglycoside 2'-N-acetyltransferase I
MSDVRLVTTDALSTPVAAASRRLMDLAFDDFTDDDWSHALGGWHAVIGSGEGVVAHAAVVPRAIVVGGREYRAGYVEAVAVQPDLQGTGLGTGVMAAIDDLIRTQFQLGVLSTGEWHFYERLGWERWRGPAFVRMRDGQLVRAADEDDGVMVLRCAATADIDPTAPIACDERSGDSW